MGDIADMMLDGTLCEACGCYLDDGAADGYPRYCSPQCAKDRGATYVRPPGHKVGSGKRRRNKLRRKRIAQKNRERLSAFDATGWKQLSPVHFRKVVDGKNLDHWPSTGKWMFDGVVHRDGLADFLNQRNQGEKNAI